MALEGEKNQKVSQEKAISQSNQKDEFFNREELLGDIKDLSLKKLASEEYIESQNKYEQEKNILS